MPVERKPVDLNFFNMEEEFLHFMLAQYDLGELIAVSPFILSGPYLELLEVRSQTSKKLILHTCRGTYFLKQIPWYADSETILNFSHSFQLFLKKNGFPLPKILPTKSGTTFIEFNQQKFFLSEFIEGRPFQNRPEDIEAAALCLAQLHHLSEFFNPAEPWPRENLVEILGNHIDLVQNIAVSSVENNHKRKEIMATLDRLGDLKNDLEVALEKRDIYHIPPIAVHGDFIPWNLALGKGEVSAVYDFDNSCMDTRLHDVGEAVAAFFGLDYEGNTSNHRPAIRTYLDEDATVKFLESYHSNHPLGREQIKALPLFITGAWLECLLLGFVRGDHKWHEVPKMFKITDYMKSSWPRIACAVFCSN